MEVRQKMATTGQESESEEAVEKVLNKGNCCSLGKSKYIDEVNQMLLNGKSHTDVWRWLKDRGMKISRNTTRKHSQHFLLPASGLSNSIGNQAGVAENMKTKKQKNPILQMSKLIDQAHERLENLMQREEEQGELSVRVDKLITEIFKMQKEYAQMVGERETDETYINAELTLTLISTFQKVKAFENPDVKHRFVKSLKSILSNGLSNRHEESSGENT